MGHTEVFGCYRLGLLLINVVLQPRAPGWDLVEAVLSETSALRVKS